MSLSNMLEVFTKDSVDFSEANSSALGARSRPSTSHSARTDSQLSLESLPPEVPHYASSGLPPPQSPTNQRPSPGSSNSGPTSPHKNEQNHSTGHHHSWGATNVEDTYREELTSSQMLRDKIQQLSDKIHSELRPLQGDGEIDSSLCRIDGYGTADNSSSTSDHKSRSSAPVVREDISSGNSTLVDEFKESLNTSADEDSKDLNSSAIVVYSEVNESPTCMSNTEEQEQLHEDLEHNGGAFGNDGDDRHTQKGSGKAGVGGRKLPTDDIDPKLYKALEKMRKLDERLANVTKKEREVKRQRKLLEQQLERIDSSSEAGSEDQSSTALMAIDDYEESIPTSPVFVTHLEDNSSSAGEKSARTKGTSIQKDDSSHEEKSENTTKEKQSSKKGQGQGQQENVQGTNFIKRNIELASDAGALVSMTESEKKRLEELLCDDRELEDPYSGPAVVGAIEGEGFSYSKEDLDKMSNIDSQLQLMIPPSDWESICSSTSRNTTPTATAISQSDQSPDHNTLDTNSLDDDEEGSLSLEPSITSNVVEEPKRIVPGEEVLHHFQMSREESKRLKDIEERLLTIREENERIQQEPIVPLAITDLQSLLEQCTRELQCSNSAPDYDSHVHSDGTASQSSDGRVSRLATCNSEGEIGVDTGVDEVV